MMPKFSYITSRERLAGVYNHLKEERYLFLDTEVSGDQIRLVQVGGKKTYSYWTFLTLGKRVWYFLRGCFLKEV